MKCFVFRMRWSQTDDELVAVMGNTAEEARAKLSKSNARYIDAYGEARLIK